MARGALKNKASESRAKLTRSQSKKAKTAPTEVSAIRALAMKLATCKHKRVTVACAPFTWRSLLSMADDGDAHVTCIDVICVETLHEALGGDVLQGRAA